MCFYIERERESTFNHKSNDRFQFTCIYIVCCTHHIYIHQPSICLTKIIIILNSADSGRQASLGKYCTAMKSSENGCVSYSKLSDKVVSHAISSPLFLPLGMILWCFKHNLATTEDIIAKSRATFFQEAVHVRSGFAQQSQGAVAAPWMDWLRSAAWNFPVCSVEFPWSLFFSFPIQQKHHRNIVASASKSLRRGPLKVTPMRSREMGYKSWLSISLPSILLDAHR